MNVSYFDGIELRWRKQEHIIASQRKIKSEALETVLLEYFNDTLL